MKTVLLLAVLLAGCASFDGVVMTEAEAKACKAEGCSVWTLKELQGMARRFFTEGYRVGASVKSI